MKSLGPCPIGTGGGQGPMQEKTADELGATKLMTGEIKPLPYKTSKEASIARHGGNC